MMESRKVLYAVKYVFIIVLFADIFYHFHTDIPVLIFFCILTILLMLNDYIRYTKIRNSYLIFASIIISISGAVILNYFASGSGTEVYIFFSLADIVNIKSKFFKPLLLIHIIGYMMSLYLKIGFPYSMKIIQDYGIYFLTYLGVAGALFLFNARKEEQSEIKILNEELRAANIKLKEYSMKVEELTIIRERTRLAQELHDSLGHSLMALSMHLEFARRVFESKPEKSREMLLKAEGIAKDSINDLREAVKTLKDAPEVKYLNRAINEMLDNFRLVRGLRIDFQMNNDAEEASPDIKSCIYKTVKEALTNSIRHGKPTEINIMITTIPSGIKLHIGDNGAGCNEIVRSNGICGIEERIALLGGNVNISSSPGKGFIFDIVIPLSEEDMQ